MIRKNFTDGEQTDRRKIDKQTENRQWENREINYSGPSNCCTNGTPGWAGQYRSITVLVKPTYHSCLEYSKKKKKQKNMKNKSINK